jgi:uncharacterized coiled-coil protein SlyX
MGLKDLFIKPVQEKPPEQSGDSAPVAAAPVNPLTRERLPRTAPVAADLDTAPFTEQLNDALDKADLPGQQTYLAFSKALKNMEKLPMDEATKFQAAFATLQATGSDVNQLIGSFSYFATIGDSVVEKENEIKKLTEENNDHSAEIKKLTEAITANQGNIERLQGELAGVNARLKQKENSFMEAYRMMKQQLQADEQKINMYLAPAIAAGGSSTAKHKK